MKKYLVGIALMVIVLSCSRNQEIAVFKPELKFTIDLTPELKTDIIDYPAFEMKIVLDDEDNIYITKPSDGSLLKYDKEGTLIGKHVSDYIKKGVEVFFRGGYLRAASGWHKIQMRFDREMNFLDLYPFSERRAIISPAIVNDTLLVSTIINPVKEGEKVALNISVCLLDTLFRAKNTIYEQKYYFEPETMNQMNIFNFVASSEKLVYMADKSEDKFMIHIFDINGDPAGTIKRDYEPIEIKDWEKKNFMGFLDEYHKGNPYKKINAEFKKPVLQILYDKLNNSFWVIKSAERSNEDDTKIYIDIYKNEKFSRTIILDIGKKWYDFVYNDFEIKLGLEGIYVKDIKNNELLVYEMIKF